MSTCWSGSAVSSLTSSYSYRVRNEDLASTIFPKVPSLCHLRCSEHWLESSVYKKSNISVLSESDCVSVWTCRCPRSRSDLSLALEDCMAALDLFLRNQFEEAQARLKCRWAIGRKQRSSGLRAGVGRTYIGEDRQLTSPSRVNKGERRRMKERRSLGEFCHWRQTMTSEQCSNWGIKRQKFVNSQELNKYTKHYPLTHKLSVPIYSLPDKCVSKFWNKFKF